MIKFIGPSYQLATRKADCQRSINLFIKQIESGTGKQAFILEDLPGLTLVADLSNGEVRGACTTTQGACYFVAGDGAFRLNQGGATTRLGTLSTSIGPVEMMPNDNEMGIVDGPNGYTIALDTDTFAIITDPAFYGSKTLTVIDGYGMFVRPDTGQFYISSPNDFHTYDALDFATAEGSPDNLSAILADGRQARLFGTDTTEGWFNSGDPDFPFSRDQSSYSNMGTIAPYSVRNAANSVCFIGKSAEGDGVVYLATGNAVQRVSTHAVEEALQSSTDLTMARAFTYQDGGHLFYVLNAPGLDTTWVYDLSTQSWHERAEVGAFGGYAKHRAVCHTFAFGQHLVGALDGKVYRFDRTVFTNDGDPLPRRRISPHNAGPSLERVFFGPFELDAGAGDAPLNNSTDDYADEWTEDYSGTSAANVPVVQMRYSNDGARTWGDWRQRELGRTGQYGRRVRWLGNGSAYDRVWDVQCTDNAPFPIINAVCAEALGG